MKNSRNLGIILYIILSALVGIYLLSVYLAAGSSGMDDIFKVGPASYKRINVFVICACWLLAGVVVVFIRWPSLARGHALFITLFILLSFFHLNVLREPHLARRGDFGVYWKAVQRVEAGEPLPNGYIYPPLLTSLLQPFYSLGCRETSIYFKMSNYIAVLLAYLLLYAVLQRYGFSTQLAAVAPFALLIFNVPLYRAVAYNQITLHVFNFILLSLLLYQRCDLLSAVALCLAINLKVTPIVFLIPFIFNREWRWLFFFLLAQAVIVVYTCRMSGAQYWGGFLYEASKVMAFAYRNSSIDSFIFNLFRLVGLPTFIGRIVTAAIKVFFVVLTIRLWLIASRRGVFFPDAQESRGLLGDRRISLVYNGYIALTLLMLIVSPRAWAHYYVVFMLPFLVMFKSIRGQRELMVYLIIYALIYLVPVFDLFPLSYYRLLGVLLCYGLLWVFCRPEERGGIDWGARVEETFSRAAVSWR